MQYYLSNTTKRIYWSGLEPRYLHPGDTVKISEYDMQKYSILKPQGLDAGSTFVVKTVTHGFIPYTMITTTTGKHLIFPANQILLFHDFNS